MFVRRIVAAAAGSKRIFSTSCSYETSIQELNKVNSFFSFLCSAT